MCYIEAFKTTQINNKFARMTTPAAAFYFATLIGVLEQVNKKSKFDPNSGMFKLNRKFVLEETGIDATEQKNIDQMLVKLGVVNVDPENQDQLAVDMKRYLELITSSAINPETVLAPTAKLTRAEKQIKKVAWIIDSYATVYCNLVNREVTDHEVEVIKKLIDVYYHKGVVKKAQWEQVFAIIIACAKDVEAIEELVNYIIATNYTSIPAAVDSFMKKHAANATKTGAEQKKCTGVASLEF